MAAAWRALMKLLGVGKKEEEKSQPVRYHPYDDVSDEQLEENRRRPPRSHPYDEVSDDQLQQKREEDSENRSKTPRVHPYDQVEPQCGNTGGRTRAASPKMKIVSQENGTNSTPRDSGLNYIEVEIQPAKGSNSARSSRPSEQPTIYSEVRPAYTKPT